MDESLLELENELKRLRPRAPSAKLLASIEAGIAASARAPASLRPLLPPQPLFWPWLTWQKIAAAAAVLVFAAVGFTIRRPLPRAPDQAALQPIAMAAPATSLLPSVDESPVSTPVVENNRYLPVGAASVLYDLREESAVTRTTSAPVRRLRYRYVDTYTWKNPATNASLKWSLPRDEVRVLPAVLH